MCGLAGIALRQGQAPSGATLDALTAALAHRGPDGHGHHVAGSVALSHTRLSIIDLVTGDQPLFAGAAALVANGEVYNYRELRDAHHPALRDRQRLRAAAAPVPPRRHRLRRDPARHVCHRPA